MRREGRDRERGMEGEVETQRERGREFFSATVGEECPNLLIRCRVEQ